jgi:2-polyprenyl-3-methyl-5-hydroxy-6-metoxy-1,4-benzoquinol methylase
MSMPAKREKLLSSNSQVLGEQSRLVESPWQQYPSEAHHEAIRPLSYYTAVRKDVVALIPAGVRSVMEVGCAGGKTGELLRNRGVDTLIGIEIDQRLASLAQKHYSQLLIGDAEELELAHIPGESLDCILYPDVLEHFRDPWAVLSRHRRLLRVGGYVVASVPNVRYYKNVRDLVLRGRWDYAEAGILDRGHLRFFTWKSVEALFKSTGYRILSLRSNVRGSNLLRLVNRMVLNQLHHFLVKQYLVLAQKTDE